VKHLVILVLNLALVGDTFAQRQQSIASNPFSLIRGTVVDSKDSAPVGYANVILKAVKDSAFVKGVATGVNGEFLLGNVAEGNYYLVVSYIGYTKRTVTNIRVSGNPKDVNLGVIKLDQTAVAMNTVQVTAERPQEEFRPDKKVINVAQNLQATGGTAVDVLSKQPSVQVDADGNVSLRGSSNFTVLVNGRPSPLQGTDALRQIAATTIENIEIITNPSARYDAEGAAGIININLKSSNDYTSSGLINLGVGTRDKYNGDASGSLSVDRISASGGIDYRNQTNFFPFSIQRTSPGANGDLMNNSDMDRKMKRENLTLRASIDYKLTNEQTVSVSGSIAKYGYVGDWFTKVTNVDGSQITYAYIVNNFEIPATFVNGQFNYSYKITPQVDELTLEATISKIKIPNAQTTEEYVSDAAFSVRQTSPLKTILTNDALRNEGRVKLNFSHKYGPKSALEAGLQTNLSHRDIEVVSSTYSWTTSVWVADPELTNGFSLKSNVYAGFVTYSNSLFEIDFQAGVRMEQMDRLLDVPALDKTYALKRLDFFPSFNMSRKIDDHTFQFTYSRRISRPNDGFLNPAPYYSDSYIRQTGNPNLVPEYINSFELNYQKPIEGVFVNVQTYMRLSTGGLIQTQTVQSDGRLLLTFENLANSSTYGAELSASFSLGSVWKFDPSVNVSSFTQEGSTATEKFDTKSFGVTSRLNATAIITSATRLQITGNYFGKQMFGQMSIEPRFLLGVSIRQEFFEKQLSLTLNAQNLLSTANMKVNQEVGSLRSYSLMRPELQMINFVLSYNFNNFKRSASQGVDIGADIGR
jgi:outer membrane receptor protein involved in Fe transport